MAHNACIYEEFFFLSFKVSQQALDLLLRYNVSPSSKKSSWEVGAMEINKHMEWVFFTVLVKSWEDHVARGSYFIFDKTILLKEKQIWVWE
jgi:hypothetical protein